MDTVLSVEDQDGEVGGSDGPSLPLLSDGLLLHPHTGLGATCWDEVSLEIVSEMTRVRPWHDILQPLGPPDGMKSLLEMSVTKSLSI